MKNKSSLSVVIPTYNDQKTISAQLVSIIEVLEKLDIFWEVIIANDCSTDSTKNILKKFVQNKKIRIINNSRNKGISKNIKYLYSKANYEFVLLFSVDGNWRTTDIASLYNAAVKNSADIVIGERKEKYLSISRKVISFLYRYLTFLFFAVDVIDPGSIKCFKKSVYKNIKLYSKSIYFEAELIIKAKKNGYKVISVPVRYTTERNEKSSVNLQLLFESVRDLIKLRIIGV